MAFDWLDRPRDNEKPLTSEQLKDIGTSLESALKDAELRKNILSLFDSLDSSLKDKTSAQGGFKEIFGGYLEWQKSALTKITDPSERLKVLQATTKHLLDTTIWYADKKWDVNLRASAIDLINQYTTATEQVSTQTHQNTEALKADLDQFGEKYSGIRGLPEWTEARKWTVGYSDKTKREIIRIVDTKSGNILHTVPLSSDGGLMGDQDEHTYIINGTGYKIAGKWGNFEMKSVPSKNPQKPAATPVKPQESAPRQKEAIPKDVALQSKQEMTSLLEKWEAGKTQKLSTLPGVSFIKYTDQTSMNQVFGKMTAFTENNRTDFSDTSSWNYAWWHDVSSDSIATYLNTFQTSLTPEEKQLRDRLITEGIISKKWESFIGTPNKAVIAMFYPSGETAQLNWWNIQWDIVRSKILEWLEHEALHWLYFTNPDFKKATDDIWMGLDPKTQKEVSGALSKNYKNTKFHATEFLSYALFTDGKAEIQNNIIPANIGNKDEYLQNLRGKIRKTIESLGEKIPPNIKELLLSK